MSVLKDLVLVLLLQIDRLESFVSILSAKILN